MSRNRLAGPADPRGKAFAGFTSVAAIQRFLDSTRYSADPFGRAPLRVLRDRTANCFDGALLAAAALRRLGHPPLLVDLRAVRDDDHVIAVFRRHGRWGAVAKSNFVGLRFREPIHRTLRELVLSYFEPFYNLDAEKTLRAYSRPVDLAAFDPLDWVADDAAVDIIGERLDAARHYPLLSRGMIAALQPVDRRSFRAGMLGASGAGLYRPEPRRRRA